MKILEKSSKKWTRNYMAYSKTAIAMKTYLLLLVAVCISSSLMSQSSLKDSLFKGKLKNPLADQAAAQKDSLKAEAAKDSVTQAAINATTPGTTTTTSATNSTDPSAPATDPAKPLDMTMPDSLNNLYYAKQKAWKRFIEQQTMIISTQADESKKVKKGEYYIEFDYTIGINGRVKASNITVSPKNDFITETITDILSRPPVLAPPVYGDGKPRPITAKQQITILKK